MSPQKMIKEDLRTRKLSFEYVLPDYEPTLKRVMLSGARVLPNERIMLGDSLTVSGNVEYRMVYQSVDDELASLCFVVPYEFTFALQETAERFFERVALSSFSCMPSGPRRVIAKGELCASLQFFGEDALPSLVKQEDLHVLEASFPTSSYRYCTDEQREYAQTLQTLSDPSTAVLYSDAVIHIESARPMKDGAFVVGKCILNALISENAAPRQICSEISFEEFLPMGETLDENASVRVCADVHSLSLAVESEEGENHLVSHILVSFRATAVEPCQIHLPLDAYSTRTKVSAVTTPYSLCCEKGSESFCETLPMRIRAQEADPSPMAEILYVASDAQILECTAREAAIDVTLKLNVSLIGRDGCEVVGAESADGGDAASSTSQREYVRQKAEESFTLSLPFKGADESMRTVASEPSVFSVRATLEEDGFTLNAEVGFDVTLREERMLSVCTDVEGGMQEEDSREDCVCIVFPDGCDTLWSLAKENRAAIDDILKENPEIQCDSAAWNSKESLAGVRHVLLP